MCEESRFDRMLRRDAECDDCEKYNKGYENAINDILKYFEAEGFPCCGCGMCVTENDFKKKFAEPCKEVKK